MLAIYLRTLFVLTFAPKLSCKTFFTVVVMLAATLCVLTCALLNLSRYFPSNGTDMTDPDLQVVGAVLKRVVQVEGAANLAFEGIVITHTAPTFLDQCVTISTLNYHCIFLCLMTTATLILRPIHKPYLFLRYHCFYCC